MKAEIGQWQQRLEDPALLRGEGRFTDDINEPGQAYAWMVRSQHAHGILCLVSRTQPARVHPVLRLPCPTRLVRS